jgi:outer membrane protein
MRMLTKPLFFICLATLSHSVLSDTLKDIYELALQNDAQLKASEAQFRANLQTEEKAFSQLLPQINASYDYEDNSSEGRSVQINPLTGQPVSPSNTISSDRDTTREGYAVSLQQKIFDLNSWFTFKSGKAFSETARARFASEQQDLIVRVSEAYFNVLRAQDNLASIRAEEKAVQRQLEQTQQRFDVGLIAITDVHEARAAHDLIVVERLNGEGQLGIALEALTVITGQSHNNLWLLKEDFPVTNPQPETRSEWVDFALKGNYELKAAGYESDSALLQAKAAKANHYPIISGNIIYSDFSEDGKNTWGSIKSDIDSTNENTMFGLKLTVPIYSGGGTSATRREAYEQYNAARELQTNTMRNTIQFTRSLHLLVITDAARVVARKQSITSTQSALDATQAGYEVGTRNVVDVLQAQRALYGSLRDYANARYDYVVDMMKLKKQAGILSPQDIYDLNNWLAAP